MLAKSPWVRILSNNGETGPSLYATENFVLLMLQKELIPKCNIFSIALVFSSFVLFLVHGFLSTLLVVFDQVQKLSSLLSFFFFCNIFY